MTSRDNQSATHRTAQNPSELSANGASASQKTMATQPPELDDFGLPIRRFSSEEKSDESPEPAVDTETQPTPSNVPKDATDASSEATSPQKTATVPGNGPGSTKKDSQGPRQPEDTTPENEAKGRGEESGQNISKPNTGAALEPQEKPEEEDGSVAPSAPQANEESKEKGQDFGGDNEHHKGSYPLPRTDKVEGTMGEGDIAKDVSKRDSSNAAYNTHMREPSLTSPKEVSEFSHQQITKRKEKDEEKDEGGWQEMPSYAPYDIYDDDNKLIAKEHHEEEDDNYGYAGLGGAGKGYTRVLLDDDAESATSMDENTQYLFRGASGTNVVEDDEEQRDAVSQLQATKDLLTEGQRIAYVGIVRLELSSMAKEAEELDPTAKKKPKKEVQVAAESMKMWAQKMMIRLYSHMDISPAEQVMIEQLSEHGVVPEDLTGALMQNSRVQNPMRDGGAKPEEEAKGKPGTSTPSDDISKGSGDGESPTEAPPAYEAHAHDGEDLPGVRTPSQLPTTQKLDIDLRWTVLCDLFLVLIADSIYDSRSRSLLERLGKDLEIPWIDICRFEKRVTDALEMQQAAEKENWNEEEHMESRRKMALKRRYVMMGLATVGGGLVIGLSAGLLAPVIGAGLAAGFTTIGVTGTSSFLAGTAGAAIITSGAAASGSYIGGKAANRRTGAVKTFEYRPLHNNKRVNLIVTVSGWMTGKVDDVRLPFSTVDPIMGDIYSILWEPEMLTSMGDTINILATEALTQGLQQILGSTILISLMAALQLPVVLSKLSYLIDNPWAVSLDRATSAGLILADSLIERNLGTRPVTLVGYSLGSRVIFSCLQELAKKGAYGLVQNVYIFGSPVVVKTEEFLKARTVISGRFVNGFNRNDWILGYLFRLTNGGIRRVAGLGPISEIKGVENIDVTEYVVGHMDYRQAMPRLLREVCGWLVESDEFTEIEDPDPENHTQRQRELINEIEEARKELEKQGAAEEAIGKKKSRFSLFGRKKKLEKAEWEVYDEALKKAGKSGTAGKDFASVGLEGDRVKPSGKTEDAEGNNHGVLFDVDAIRAELAREAARERSEKDGQPNANGTGTWSPSDNQTKNSSGRAIPEDEIFQVKEIKSTLPPMRLDIGSGANRSVTPTPSTLPNRPSLHESSFAESKSTSHLPYRAGSFDARRSTSPIPPSKSPAHSYGGAWNNGAGAGGGYGSGPGAGGFGSSAAAGGGGWGGEEEEISMTFDTSFREPSPPPPVPAKDASVVPGTIPSVNVTSAREPSARPEMKTSKTAPPPAIPAANPWADHDDFDDPDFGKEKDIEMTFA